MTGWVSSDTSVYEAYIPALYFIVKTITAVGYGDMNGSTSVSEMWFVMMLEIVGLVVFSAITGSIRNIGS